LNAFEIYTPLHANQELPVSNTNKNAFSATKILLPLDFGPSSEAALEAAAGLAQQFHACIHLVHVIPESPNFNGSDFFPITSVLDERRQPIEEKLNERKKQLLLKGVPTSFSVETGNDVARILMDVIKHEKADMVVISTHGISGWRPMMLGSTAEHLIKQVNCTLLLLQSDRHGSAVREPAIELGEESFVRRPGEMTVSEPGALAQRQLDWTADGLAEQGQRTEQRYDESHSLFTK
jgi:nucleotide-binding universal stress UspA family protein